MWKTKPGAEGWIPAICGISVLLLGSLLQVSPAAAETGEPPAYTVQIFADQTQVLDGMPIIFTAVTSPPGFEDQVQWTTLTRCGRAEPATGEGKFFQTVFFDTYCLPPDECRWLAVRANEAEFIQQTPDDCIPDITVPAGPDCWETDDCTTKASFCTDPLPMDFFCPGSPVWRGEIPLQGPEDDDTIVERKAAMSFPGWNIQSVKVELTKLDLEGCDTIIVDCDDGNQIEWSVKVEQSDFQEEGDMTVSRQHDNGGSFQTSFPIHTKFTFTDVADPDNVIVLDTGDPNSGHTPVVLNTLADVPWVSQLDPELGVSTCGTNFTPGISPDGWEEPGSASLSKAFGGGLDAAGSYGTPNGNGQCCVDIGHAGPGRLHKTGRKCRPCPPGACYNPATLECKVIKKEQCELLPGWLFQGMGTNCGDRDGDGLPDFVEKNDCCKAGQIQQSTLMTLSDPFNSDTDGDGINDGDEILQGRDPCTAGS